MRNRASLGALFDHTSRAMAPFDATFPDSCSFNRNACFQQGPDNAKDLIRWREAGLVETLALVADPGM